MYYVKIIPSNTERSNDNIAISLSKIFTNYPVLLKTYMFFIRDYNVYENCADYKQELVSDIETYPWPPDVLDEVLTEFKCKIKEFLILEDNCNYDEKSRKNIINNRNGNLSEILTGIILDKNNSDIHKNSKINLLKNFKYNKYYSNDLNIKYGEKDIDLIFSKNCMEKETSIDYYECKYMLPNQFKRMNTNKKLYKEMSGKLIWMTILKEYSTFHNIKTDIYLVTLSLKHEEDYCYKILNKLGYYDFKILFCNHICQLLT